MKKGRLHFLRPACLTALLAISGLANSTMYYWHGAGAAAPNTGNFDFNGANWTTSTAATASGTTPTFNTANDFIMVFDGASSTTITLSANTDVKSLTTNLITSTVNEQTVVVSLNGKNLTVSGTLYTLCQNSDPSPDMFSSDKFNRLLVPSGSTLLCNGLAINANGTATSNNSSTHNTVEVSIGGTLTCTGNLGVATSGTTTTYSLLNLDGNATTIAGTTDINSTNSSGNGGPHVGSTDGIGGGPIYFIGDVSVGVDNSPTFSDLSTDAQVFFTGNVTLSDNAQSNSPVGLHVIFNGTTQLLNEAAFSFFPFNNFTVGNGITPTSLTLSSSGSADSYGDLTINNGSIFDISQTRSSFTSDDPTTAVFSINGNGKLTTNGYSLPATFATYNFDATSTVEYTNSFFGAGNVIGGIAYGNLSLIDFSNSTLGADGTTVAGNLTIDATSSLDLGTYTLNRTAAGGIFNNDGILKLGGTNNFPANYATNTLGSTSTVNYYANGAQTVSAQNYGNLIFGASGLKTFAGSTGIAGNLTLTGTATADAITNTTTINYNGTAAQSMGSINYSDLIISGSGQKTFAGNTTITGNFSVAGTATGISNGTITYNGSTSQTMGGISYTNLVANNTANSLLILGENASVSGSIILNTPSIISTRATATVLTVATDLIGIGSNSFVDGKVSKTGSSNFTFPVGDAAATAGSVYHALGITAPTASTTATVSYEASGATPNNDNAHYNLIHTIDPSAYWIMAATAATGATSAVTIATRDESGVFEPGAQVFLVGYNIANGYWEQLGNLGTLASNGEQSLSSSAPVLLSNYSAFTVGSTGYLLPITLIGFTGVANSCTANLAWQTSTESNSSYYGIEASVDGSNFNQVGKLASKNNLRGAAYSFNYALRSGTNYFRLKAMDFDGKFGYSSIITVTGTGNCGAGIQVKVSPNPTSNMLNLQGLTSGSRIVLMGTNGQKLTEVTATGSSQSINLRGYANGVYLLRIQAADGTVSKMMVLKN